MPLNCRLLFLLVALGTLGSARSGLASTELANLPEPVQDEIGRLCLPVQYREGATAYRNCVTSEIGLRSTDTGSPMAQLSFDDKYAVQQACAKAGSESPEQYRSCINEQMTALEQEPVPVLDNLSDDEQYAIQQTCFAAQSRQGAGEYRRCVNQELNKLLEVPRVNLGELSVLQRNALQLRCSAISTDAAGYRQCLAEESGLPTGFPDAISAESPTGEQTPSSDGITDNASVDVTAPAAVTQADSTANTDTPAQPTAPSVAGNPADAELQAQPTPTVPRNATPLDQASSTTLGDSNALVLAEPIEAPVEQEPFAGNRQSEDVLTPVVVPQAPAEILPDSEADSQTTSDFEQGMVGGILNSIATLQQRALTGFASLNEYGRLVLAAILALPLLLVAWVAFKRKRRNRYELPMGRPAMQPAPVFDDVDDDDFNVAQFHAQRAAEEPTRTVRLDHRAAFAAQQAREAPDAAVTRIATKPALRKAQSESLPNASTDNQSGFGKWLEQQPQSHRLQNCVEFLIYWMAYGDERYDPAMKRKLFLARDLNTHDQIKRWVLKQDVNAFADVIAWTRLHATAVQLEQIVDLLMALLVTPNSVTPVQTTLLRFLGDVFGMGSEVLEARFERAFGHHLPGVPRVDKLAWWQKLSQQQIDRWETPFLTKIPEREQLKARLGLDDDFSEAEVVQAFRRAARRCHPDCFNALDEQERVLAARQFTKFEEARDRLLGVSV